MTGNIRKSPWDASVPVGRPLHGQLNRVPHTTGPVTGVALLGTVAASLASLFRLEDKADEDDDAADGAAPVAGPAVALDVAAELRALRAEVAALREAIVPRDP